MHLTLTAIGAESRVALFRIEVDGDGRWHYESRGVAGANGQLSPADRAQLKSLYDRIDWELEVLNGPKAADDRVHFALDVTHDEGKHQHYQFSENLAHRSWQFRDLVHFLRHNVATAGDPVAWSPDQPEEHPPLPM